jgi:hypothetical protein
MEKSSQPERQLISGTAVVACDLTVLTLFDRINQMKYVPCADQSGTPSGAAYQFLSILRQLIHLFELFEGKISH